MQRYLQTLVLAVSKTQKRGPTPTLDVVDADVAPPRKYKISQEFPFSSSNRTFLQRVTVPARMTWQLKRYK